MRYHLCPGRTDMRKGINSLIGVVKERMGAAGTTLCLYLGDGRLLLDNNLAENEIRPTTLVRKNYMLCGNHESAKDMCVIQSLLATCRNHDVNPRLYLNSVSPPCRTSTRPPERT